MEMEVESIFLEEDAELLILRFLSLFDSFFHVDQLILMTSLHRDWTLPFRDLIWDVTNAKLNRQLNKFAGRGLVRHFGGGWWDIITEHTALSDCECAICVGGRESIHSIKVAVFKAFVSSICQWVKIFQ